MALRWRSAAVSVLLCCSLLVLTARPLRPASRNRSTFSWYFSASHFIYILFYLYILINIFIYIYSYLSSG